MSKSFIVNYITTTMAINLTRYAPITGQIIPTTNEGWTEFPIRDAGTFSNSFVDVDANTITADTTFTFRVNGADTSIVVTYASGQTGIKEDTLNTATVTATDVVSYKIITGSTGVNIRFFQLAIQFEPDAAGDTITILGTSGGAYNHAQASNTKFSHMQGSTTVIETTEDNSKYIIRGTFTGSNLYANVTTNDRTTDLVIKARKNSADGAQSLTYATTQSGIKEDTTNTDSLVAGDGYNFAITTLTGSEQFIIRTIIVKLLSTADEFVLQCARQFSQGFSGGTTNYNAVAAILSAQAAEDDTKIWPRFAFNAKQMNGYAVSNTSSNDATITLRQNLADTGLAITWSATQTGLKLNSSNVIAITSGSGGVDYKIAIGAGGSVAYSWIGMLGTTSGANNMTADVGAFTLTGIAAFLDYSNAPVTYIQKVTTSDLSPTWPNTSEGDYEMSEGTGSDTGIAISIAANATETLSFITPSDKPNSDQWLDSGTYTVELELDSGNHQLSAICYAVRLNSTGTILQTGAATGSQTLSGNVTFSVVAPAWTNGDEACGNRLAIRVDIANAQSMTNAATFGVGTIANEVITDLVEDDGTCGGVGAFTLTADVGTFTLTGLATGLKADRQLVAALGTFTLTGIAAGLVFGRTLVAALGTFTLTGIAAGLAVVRLVVDTGVFTITSHASVLKANSGGEVEKFNTDVVVDESSPGFDTYGGGTLPANVKDDDPSTGIQTDTTGRFIRFDMNDVTGITGFDTINFVTFYLKARKSAASGTGRFRLRILDSGQTFTDGGNLTLTTEYVYWSEKFTLAPAGGSWSVSELNGLLLQILAVSVPASQTIDAAEVFAEVDYTEPRALTLAAALGTFTLTGLATGLKADRQLVAALGTFTLTGFAATLTFSPAAGAFTLVADTGTFTLTGIATGLKADRQLVAALVTFTLTGIAAGLVNDFVMPAALGTFTLTGLATGLKADRQLVAALATFTLTGLATGLKADRQLVAALATFTLTGVAANLPTGKGLTAATGTFTLTGIATGLVNDSVLSAALATFALTGIAAGLANGFVLPAATGTFTLTGVAANLPTGKGLTAATGTFTLTGIATDLKADRQLVAALGSFTLTGIATGLANGFVLPATVAAFVLTGIAANLPTGKALTAATGTFTLTGIAAALVNAFVLPATVAAFVLTGPATGLKADRQLVAALGTFTLTGIAALLNIGGGDVILTVTVAAFVLAGIAIDMLVARTLPPIVTLASPGILNLTLTSPGIINLNLKGGN